MVEQTFRSPNFYEREIDLSAPRPEGPLGTPAGVIGTSQKGPAFVPVTIGNFDDFVSTFGNLDPKCFGPYAVNEFMKYRTSLTYLRVLGAGANNDDADIDTTRTTGQVTGAGMYLDGVIAQDDQLGRKNGLVQFLVATHNATSFEAFGMPMLTDNDSIADANNATLVRGIFMTPESARIMIAADPTTPNAFDGTDPDETNIAPGVFNGKFKLIVSSTLGNAFANTDGSPGVKIFTASLNPTDPDYFAKVMNTNPDKFVQEQHFVYAHFPVDAEVAVAEGPAAILSGSSNTSPDSGEPTLEFEQAFGRYNTRYTTPVSPWIISQPFGATEHDLFKFETLDDGEYANKLYKVAITDLKLPVDDANQFCTFTVQIRDWNDTDTNPLVLESYPNCTLNPKSSNYIAKLIGDLKVFFDFDANSAEERRLVTEGKYENVSKLVRIVVHEDVEREIIPPSCVPFGFRGMELPKTNDLLTDAAPGTPRLAGNVTTPELGGAILPPIPFRFKVTKGDVDIAGGFQWPGEPGRREITFSPFHWGVKFERNTDPLNSNVSSAKNELLGNFTKFLGISKLDTLVTGSGADRLNNNKFTLARVALSNLAATNVSSVITGSAVQHMREAAYIRNGAVDPTDYTINDGYLGSRLTLASLLNGLTAPEFNKFSPFTKFVTFLHGGWDGVNILDRDARRMNDRASSFENGGGAEASFVSPGFDVSNVNFGGVGQDNSTVWSYKTAADIMTDPNVSDVNILTVPGIREPFLTDYTMNRVRDYGLAYYVMDIPAYDDAGERLFDDSEGRPNVDKTAAALDARVVDNNYAGTYFPDVFIDDATNRRRVKVPASIAAYGALAFNDRQKGPWFAPAGFNRAALDFVNNVGVRLSVSDRDTLYDSRINPIATFPRLGFVIYGQKTLQINRSALDRVNVRRLLLEVKRVVINIAKGLIFEQNTPALRNRFVADATLRLGVIQAAEGLEAFQVIMNETNNTQEDADLNRLNGRVVIVPTRAIEYIALDFIITNSGVAFV